MLDDEDTLAVPDWRGDEDGTIEPHGNPPNLGLQRIRVWVQHEAGSEDEARKLKDEIQELTKTYEKHIDEHLESKRKEILDE